MLAAASRYGVPVLITSSSEVYGKRNTTPFREDDDLVLGNPRIARWSYACSKVLDEFLAIAYCRERSLPIIIVRLFNTAGARQTGRYGMVLPRFVRQALTGEPLTVYGDGSQRRTFCHVEDVVGVIARLFREPAAIGRIFNLGGDEEITIDELARRVKTVAASDSRIVHIPYAEAWDDQFEDMHRRRPDLSALRSLVGFEPEFSLENIITDVIRFEETAAEGAKSG